MAANCSKYKCDARLCVNVNEPLVRLCAIYLVVGLTILGGGRVWVKGVRDSRCIQAEVAYNTNIIYTYYCSAPHNPAFANAVRSNHRASHVV